MKIIFFGTSSFAARVLEYLLNHNIDVLAVVTRPDRPKGRNLKLQPSSVKELLLTRQSTLPLFQPEKASTAEFASQLKSFRPELFVVVAYGEIIKTLLLDLPTKGCINVHASLLPKYRGAAPMQRCLMNGEKETGITIMDMVLEMDAGDILEQDKLTIPEEMTLGELEEKLWHLACPLLLKTLQKIEKGTLKKIPQDPSQVTFAPKITPQEEEIDWMKSAVDLHNLMRALSAWCQIKIGSETKRLKIKKAHLIKEKNGAPGSILSYGKEGWIVACGEGALSLFEVQLEGKKAMGVQEFIRGIQMAPTMLVKI